MRQVKIIPLPLPLHMLALLIAVGITAPICTLKAQPASTNNEVNQPPTNEAKEDAGTPVVFDTMQAIEKMEPGSIVSKTFYYSNANDDPASTPIVGEENGIKYIKISATGGNPSKMADTIYKLDRWVEIPSNRPSAITVEFKTKITKNKDFEWITTPGSKEPNKRNKIVVDFMKETGQSGGGKKVEAKDLKTLDAWVNHSYTISIPPEAKYLHLGLETSGGYSLWLGDWTIK